MSVQSWHGRTFYRIRSFPRRRSAFFSAASYVRSGAVRCSKSSGRRSLRRRIYDECDQLGSCSRDPVGYEAGSNCLYEYCHSKPYSYVDPWGKQIYVPIPPGRPPKPHQPTDPLNPGWPLPSDRADDPWNRNPNVVPVTPKTICESMKGFTACAKCLPSCEKTFQELFDAVSGHPSPIPPNACIKWACTLPKPGKSNGCYKLSGQSFVFPLTGIPCTDIKLRHVVVKIDLCNGKSLLVDSGWWSWTTGNPMESPNNIFPAVPESNFPL